MQWPGLRITKTVIAVMICLIIARIFGYENPYYALIAAVIVMKSSTKDSYRHGLNRMIGSIFGGLFGFVFIFSRRFIDSNISIGGILLISSLLFLDLWSAKLLHFEEYASLMSTILLLSVLMNYSASNEVAARYLLIRILETLVGIIVSVLVNHYFQSFIELFRPSSRN